MGLKSYTQHSANFFCDSGIRTQRIKEGYMGDPFKLSLPEDCYCIRFLKRKHVWTDNCFAIHETKYLEKFFPNAIPLTFEEAKRNFPEKKDIINQIKILYNNDIIIRTRTGRFCPWDENSIFFDKNGMYYSSNIKKELIYRIRS